MSITCWFFSYFREVVVYYIVYIEKYVILFPVLISTKHVLNHVEILSWPVKVTFYYGSYCSIFTCFALCWIWQEKLNMRTFEKDMIFLSKINLNQACLNHVEILS